MINAHTYQLMLLIDINYNKSVAFFALNHGLSVESGVKNAIGGVEAINQRLIDD